MKRLLILLLPVLASCSMVDHNVAIEIQNNSDATIEDVKFSTTNDKEWVTFDELEPTESVSKVLNVKNYDADGNYSFQYTIPNGERIERKGNYMEENFVKASIIFKVQNDGVEIERKTISVKSED